MVEIEYWVIVNYKVDYVIGFSEIKVELLWICISICNLDIDLWLFEVLLFVCVVVGQIDWDVVQSFQMIVGY